jgi:ParB/RepB/Spo0J family partition protein
MLSHDIPSAVLPLDVIEVDRAHRQRREFTTDDLESSLKRSGLLHPIIVSDNGNGTYKLVAGERRFTAAGRIGWTSIPVRFADGLSQTELELIELEENIKRQDLPWTDKLNAVRGLHERYLAQDPEWTQLATAEAIGLSKGDISLFLTIADEVEARPELLEKKTAREAYNVIGRANSRKMAGALEELFQGVKSAFGDDAEALDGAQAAEDAQREAEVAASAEDILCESFLDWAPTYSGEKFNLIHCDFPYGVDLFAKEFGQRGGAKPYDDRKETYFVLLDCLLDNLDRLMSYSGHLVFWYSGKYDKETKEAFATRASSLDFFTHPFIWGKSDNAGIIGDARRDFRHTYEWALIAHRGERQVVKSVADFYSAPTDRTLHPSTKPEPMLKHIFSALVDEHTRLLDPTCGSGAALRAADALGAAKVLGLEYDPEYCEPARVALRNARKLRLASAML